MSPDQPNLFDHSTEDAEPPPRPDARDLLAITCRAAWDAGQALRTTEVAWDQQHRHRTDLPPSYRSHMALLPTAANEALRQVVDVDDTKHGAEAVKSRNIVLNAWWSALPEIFAPHSPGVASVHRSQNFAFSSPTLCAEVATQLTVILDDDDTRPELTELVSRVVELNPDATRPDGPVRSIMVMQRRPPGPEELLHLAQVRLVADPSFVPSPERPLPGFRSDPGELLERSGVQFDRDYRVFLA